MLVSSWMICNQCGERCVEYRCDRTKEEVPSGAYWRTVCVQCRRFIGYREVAPVKKGKRS